MLSGGYGLADRNERGGSGDGGTPGQSRAIAVVVAALLIPTTLLAIVVLLRAIN